MATTTRAKPWSAWLTSDGLISSAALKRTIRSIVRGFDPERIYLFGSYAHGHPTKDSDLDLLVVMPAKNEISQEIRIAWALSPPFSLDLLVRTPERLERRVKEGDWFLREVLEKGRLLYAKKNKGVGKQSRR